MFKTLAVVALAASSALAQSGAWQQCGGNNWSGSKTCVAGYTCKYTNDWYSQCIPGTASSAAPTSTLKTSTVKSSSTSSTKVSSTSSTKISSTSTVKSTSTPTPTSAPTPPWWFGINLSGAEFGEKNFSGVINKEYTWYSKSAIDTLASQGFNMFRINFLMERLTPNNLTASFEPGYLGNLTDMVNYITSKGNYAMIQPHNYGRFYGNIITDTAGFKTWWTNVANQYKNNPLVIFDTNNEYHDMDQQLVFNLNQAAIDGIRSTGATQWITPEGNSWTGAWTWVSSGNAASLVSLTDPLNKIVYQMHQYLDSDGSGTSATCVSTTIFQERLVAATNWLRANNKLGLIGEYAGGANPDCITALIGGLQYLKANKDVWTGHTWWAAGPWWGDYIYNMEPPTGTAYTGVLPSILPYAL